MTDGRTSGPEHPTESSSVLRAKYHDFCSAQLADLLLYLTPDEIYILAQRATRERSEEVGGVSFARTVEVATEWLSRRVALPSFEHWLEDYQRDPERYEANLIGFWESEADPSPEPD